MAKPERPAADPLTARQRRVLEEYLVDGNAVQAYRRAFPKTSYRTAVTESSRLLKLPELQRELRAGQQALGRQVRASARKVVRELAAVAFADISDLFEDAGWRLRPWADVPAATRKAVASITVKVQPDGAEVVSVAMLPKLDALEKLAKRFNLYRPLPPLERILGLLPPAMAATVRAAIARPGPAAGRDG